jgi:PRTRC genetic system ThiF family protein
MARAHKHDSPGRHRWTLSPGFLSPQPLTVAVAGIGGTGSQVLTGLTHLHLALQALGYGGLHVVAFDPDRVEEPNVVRQRFTRSDIGLSKSEVLIHRVNMAHSLGWEAVFGKFNGKAARSSWDIVISCVDTRRARKELHNAAFGKHFGKWKFWLDLGNTAHTGQAILGQPKSTAKGRLPCATEVHPEIRDVSIPDDDAPSCSAREALTKQDLFVSSRVALAGLDLLWEMLREGSLEHHGLYFDLRRRIESPLKVPSMQLQPAASAA